MPIGRRKMRGLNGYVKDDDLKFVIDETIKNYQKMIFSLFQKEMREILLPKC